jgi:hypothetical protein
MSENYIYAGVEQDYYDHAVYVYDENGNKVNSAVSGLYALEHIFQSAGGVYVYGYNGSESTLRKYDKSGQDLVKQWETPANGSNAWTFAKNGDPIISAYFSGASHLKRFDKTDGSEVWYTSYSTDYDGEGITRLGNGNIAVCFNDTTDSNNHVIREYDVASGEVVGEISHVDSIHPRAITRDANDNYVVADDSSDLRKYDRLSGDVIWKSNTVQANGVLWDGANYYVYKEQNVDDGQIQSFDDAGKKLWEKSYSTAI